MWASGPKKNYLNQSLTRQFPLRSPSQNVGLWRSSANLCLPLSNQQQMVHSISKRNLHFALITFNYLPFDLRRFNHDSLRILESILFSKDVKLLFQLRSSLKEFIRSESVSVILQIAVKTVDQHLSVLEFFFQAFAIIGDIEVTKIL